MLCLKKRRTYSFTQGACRADAARENQRRKRSSSSKRRDESEERYYEGVVGKSAAAAATLPKKITPREERSSSTSTSGVGAVGGNNSSSSNSSGGGAAAAAAASSAMVLTVTEDTPADMLAGSMELLVQMPREHSVQTHRVTVQRSTPMMDLLVQIATAHKLAASSYSLQAIGERGLVLPHQPNTPIGALDALQVKLLPKQGTFLSRKRQQQSNQPFETTDRLQVHMPRNQLYVSRVSPKTNLGEILDEVCRAKNLDRNKYELRHPANVSDVLNLALSLQDYHLQEVSLCPRNQQSRLGSSVSTQDIMALQRQEEQQQQQQQQQQQPRQQQQQQQANKRHTVFGFVFSRKSKESSLSSDSLGNRSVSPAHSHDETTPRSVSPIIMHHHHHHHYHQNNGNDVVDKVEKKLFQQPLPSRPLRKRRPAPKPPTQQIANQQQQQRSAAETESIDKDKIVISHSRNSSDSSGYHEASVLSDNPDNNGSSNNNNNNNNNGRMPNGKMRGILESSSSSSSSSVPRKLAHTSQASKSLCNLAMMASCHTASGGTLSRGISNTSLSSAGQRKKRAAPAPPARPLPSAISVQALERIVDSDESLTSDMELSKPSSDIAGGSDLGTSCASHHFVEPARVLGSNNNKGKLERCIPASPRGRPLLRGSCRCTRRRRVVEDSPLAFRQRCVASSCRFEKSQYESTNSVAVRGAGGGGGIASSFDNRNNGARQSKKIVVKVPTIAKLDMSETSACKLRRHVSHNVAQSCARPARRSSLELSHSYSFNNRSLLSSSRRCSLDTSSSSIIDSSWPPLPLLSNLHIFAISTKPEDIQLDETEEDDLMIPGEIDKLPSLPIIDRRQPSSSSASVVGKLSILKPPPPGLVNREESSENWSKFLENLNDILECRAGQFV